MTIKRTAVVCTLRHRWELIALVIILALGISAIIWVPEKMVQRVYRGDRSRQTADSYAKLVDDYRKTLVQMIGAVFVLYTLHLTQRRTKATEETLRTTQATLKVSRDTQITDRFTKAIAQLGAADSEGRKQLEIRFGGIYALERIAKDSPCDHWPIMEILTAYVRLNAPWRDSLPDGVETAQPQKDIQAIMTVLGRRDQQYDKRPLDLSQTDLRGIDLEDAHFERALLGKAHLEGVNLCQAHLEGAFLHQAHLEGAFLHQAHLERASLNETHLEGAFLETALGLHQADIDIAVGDHTTTLPTNLQYPDHWAECTDLMRCRSPLEIVPFVYGPQHKAAIESRRQPSAALQSLGSTQKFQLPPWDIDKLRSWRKNGTGSIPGRGI